MCFRFSRSCAALSTDTILQGRLDDMLTEVNGEGGRDSKSDFLCVFLTLWEHKRWRSLERKKSLLSMAGTQQGIAASVRGSCTTFPPPSRVWCTWRGFNSIWSSCAYDVEIDLSALLFLQPRVHDERVRHHWTLLLLLFLVLLRDTAPVLNCLLCATPLWN